MFTNIRSFVKNSNFLVSILIHKNYDLVLTTESWLGSKNDVAPLIGIASSCYSFSRCDRSHKSRGRLLVLLRNTIPFREVFKESVRDGYEVLIMDITLSLGTIRFILVYRTANCTVFNSNLLQNVISDFSCHSNPTVVLGDFNLPDIVWSQPVCLHGISLDFYNTFCSHNLSQLVMQPTRGCSFLDLLFTNDVGLVSDVRVVAPVGGSDHSAVEFTVSCDGFSSEKCYVRDFRNGDYVAIRNYLANIDWITSLGNASTVDEKYKVF